MNLLLSTVGKRGYIADFFRQHLQPGDRIVGTGNTRWTPGFHSCDEAVLMPDIDSEAYLPAFLELVERHSIDVVLSFSDPDVFRLSAIRPELEALGVLPFLPAATAAQLCFDKYETAVFLMSAAVAHPRTAIDIPSSADFGWPRMVKPRTGSGSADNFIVHDDQGLRHAFQSHPGMLIQEFVDGEELNVEVLGDLNGQPVSATVWRKYRSQLGETEQSETVADDEVLDVALRAARELGVVGPMDIDLMRSSNGVCIIEFNPRFGGGYPVSHLAGADFPGKIVRMARGEEVTPDFGYARGVVMMKQLHIIGGPKEEFLRGVHIDAS